MGNQKAIIDVYYLGKKRHMNIVDEIVIKTLITFLIPNYFPWKRCQADIK